jgi:hypothetical protein
MHMQVKFNVAVASPRMMEKIDMKKTVELDCGLAGATAAIVRNVAHADDMKA